MFTLGPSGTIVEPTIPKVLDQATGGNRMVANQLKAIDFQANGRPDILLIPGVTSVVPYVNAPVRLLRATGTGALTDVTRSYFGNGALPSAGNAGDIVIADFNRDGKPDFFLVDSGFDGPPFPGSVNMLVESTSTGAYRDLSSTLPAIPDFATSTTTADVNGDGILDIYVGTLGTANPQAMPHLLMGKADGTFDRVSSTLPVWLADGVKWEKSFLGSLFVDVDNDGYPDLVLGRWYGGLVPSESLVLLNDGNGDFSKRVPVILPVGAFGSETHVRKLASMDVNGDGFPDLVMLQGTRQTGGALQLLINRGDGTFVDETAARLGPRAKILTGFGWDRLELVDINNDGRLDIMTLVGTSDTAPPEFAWTNNGDGTLTPQSKTANLSISGSGTMLPIDINGDGNLDIVMLTYLFNSGDLFYRTHINSAPRTVPSEPLDPGVTAGNAQATVTFNAPVARGASAITGYTATCRFGASVRTGIGASSPITVTGLANGKRYACSVAATNASGTGLPSRPVTVLVPIANYSDLWWGGTAENGWGMTVQQHGTTQFNVFFVYDGTGKPIWFAMPGGTWNSTFTVYSGGLAKPTSAPLNTYDKNRFAPGVQVGTMAITYTSADTAVLNYTINGVAGSKNIERQLFGATDNTPGLQVGDMWWGGSTQDGWGVSITQQFRTLFAAWYTYDQAGNVTWYTLPGGTWSGNTYSGTLATATGSPWLGGTYNPAAFTPSAAGTVSFNFSDANNAVMNYIFTAGPFAGTTQSKPLVRQPY